ncbi:MAG: DM13 domain-containing protein [Microcella sp.]|uniref:DM13 domain-containing protein n=1 Tax=Microcella sp. TaxID=1913979 RepID=UPI00331587B5
MTRAQRVTIGISAAIIGVAAAVGITVFALANISEPAPIEVAQPPQSDLSAGAVDDDADSGSSESSVLRSGSFVDGDAVHRGSGTVSVVERDGERLLVFGDDVAITPGPDLLVYLSPNAPGEDLGEFASLGRLVATEGEQTYLLPENSDDFRTVVIWCRAFSITFATADLGTVG